MSTGDIFKFQNRHYSSQAVVSLITANYIVFALAVQLCVECDHIHWFFWVALAGLAVYNFFTIRRNSEEFGEKRIKIVYVSSIILLSVIYYLVGVAGKHC
ncbi:hypothetical protein GCM10027037_32510 [Mucilaginibacter koreensis]